MTNQYPLFFTPFGCRMGLVCLLAAGSVLSAGAESSVEDSQLPFFSVPRGNARKTLNIAARQGNVDLVAMRKISLGIETLPIEGYFEVDEAFRRLLEGTPLAVKRSKRSGSYTVVKRSETPSFGDSHQPETNPDMIELKSLFKKMTLAAAATSVLTSSANLSAQESDEEVFELSPFTVDSSQDSGYRANNTLSGTRLNSSLRDTAASISVFTEEFLEDTGLTDIEELIRYSANSVMDAEDSTGTANYNTTTNAANVLQPIRTRGIVASKGVDYFKAIVPDDSYNVSRFDDSRGPNGVLFGVSEAGGLFNRTTMQASLGEDFGRFRYSFGSNDRNRAEFRYNKVILDDRFAVAVAGLYQDNGHWRDWISAEKKRLFATAKWKINDKASMRISYENGFDHGTTIHPGTVTDEALPYYDNLLAFGVDAVTFEPTGGQPNSTLQALGITLRDGNGTSQKRFTYTVNDGVFYNASGTYGTEGYDDNAVRHPDGTPGGTSQRMRINDPEFMPYHLYVPGPDHFRETDFDMLSAFLEVSLTENWFLNAQFASQTADIDTYAFPGNRPELWGDPNLTRGKGDGVPGITGNDVANPYAGSLYFDSEWRADENNNEFDELRISSSYNWQPESKWIGKHQFAVSLSRLEESQDRHAKLPVLGGNPDNAGNFADRANNRYAASDYTNANNRIQLRNYIDLNDQSTWFAPSWRDLPATVTTDRFEGTPTEYPVVWGYFTPGNLNYWADTASDSQLAVLQSKFWNDRLVTTLGYRKDEVEITRYGHKRDPIVGWLPTKEVTADTASDINTIPAPLGNDFSGSVRTSGFVFHLTDRLSLIANESSSVGVPDFRRTVFPDGRNADPTQGAGIDVGLDFNLFRDRVSGRVVYYEAESLDVAGANLSGVNQMNAIYEILETTLEGSALADLQNRRLELRPDVNGNVSDRFSSGYEMSLTANITDNWRLNFNASHTDRSAKNLFKGVQGHLGLIKGDDGKIMTIATQGTSGAYTIDTSAYTADGALAQFIGFTELLPNGQTIDSVEISDQIETMVTSMNDRIQQEEQRFALRPWKFNIFTAYDFDEGPLKGVSTGGGYRWTSPNIIGEFADGTEIKGVETADTDFFIRYRTKKFSPVDGGRWTFQMNVYNVFDKTGIIPSVLAQNGDPDYTVPGGRPLGYARFDLLEPREYRFTATLDF